MNQQQQVQQLLKQGKAFKQSALTGKRHAILNHNAWFYSYDTAIAKVDYNNKKVLINSRKYSQTTSKHQNLVQREATLQGYTVEYLFTPTSDHNMDYLVWTRL